MNPSRTVQQATLKIDEAGVRVTVEEGRSLQGESFASTQSERATRTQALELFRTLSYTAHAYVAANAFSSYAFQLAADDPAAYVDAPRGHTDSPGSSPAVAPEPEAEALTSPYCQMSVSLSTILECLNIFGNAGAAAANTFKKEGGYDSDGGGGGDDAGGGGGGGSRWRGKRRRQGAADDDEDGDGRYGKSSGRRETADEGKTTSLRLSYAGHGEPLVMLYAHFLCDFLAASLPIHGLCTQIGGERDCDPLRDHNLRARRAPRPRLQRRRQDPTIDHQGR